MNNIIHKIFVNRIISYITFLAIFTFNHYLFAEEGMYPLSEIHKLDLKSAGLKIDINDIYNPEGISLVDALVNVGGCSGSFVSSDGLIITNHHCAFGALQAASTIENDFIEKGFLAQSRSGEIEAKGLRCRITESYEDVSEKILDSLKGITDPAERVNKLKEKIWEIERDAEIADSTIEAQISEMFEGKAYVLFRYKVIRDVRLVYIPHRQIGEFGGETDNWVWPRHTGDFSFLRAYVAPDGTPAGYSPSNIPYKPKKHLKVNPNGVSENDFVFILGYPGRTFRHKPSHFLEYQQKFQLPYTSDLYDFQIGVMNKLSYENPELAVKLTSRIKSLANTTKNYKGKLQGLRQLSLIEKKKREENKLEEFINSSPELKNKYGNIFHELDSVYSIVFKNAKRDLWFMQINRASTLIRLADILLTNTAKIQGLEGELKDSAVAEIQKNIKNDVSLLYQRFSVDADREILQKMLIDASKLPAEAKIEVMDKIITGKDTAKLIQRFIINAFDDNELADQEKFYELLNEPVNSLIDSENPIITFTYDLMQQSSALEDGSKNIEGTLDDLYANLVDVRQIYEKSRFIPDANSTLRLTYGRVKGYSPYDAVHYSPITILDGIIEKSYRNQKEYAVPDKLRVLYNKKDFGKYYNNEINGLPVAILYNTDTTGGNSGSPVLNANGELIGINFDRTYEATINDYSWDDDYSRSIGVDIRYVLWVTQKIGGADYLLDEIGVNPN